jgi:hypothetical protein
MHVVRYLTTAYILEIDYIKMLLKCRSMHLTLNRRSE